MKNHLLGPSRRDLGRWLALLLIVPIANSAECPTER